jgi:hypothetical protein
VEILARVRARHQRELLGLEVEGLDPAGLDQRRDAERLHAAPQVRDPIRIAEAADQDAIDVDLDDVATVDALLDAATDLADEDRRGAAGGRPKGGPAGGRAGWRGGRRHGSARIARPAPSAARKPRPNPPTTRPRALGASRPDAIRPRGGR